MQVICKLKREGGTKVSIGSETYHFKPDTKVVSGDHVAEVGNSKHLARFLSIEEAYCLPGDVDAVPDPFDVTDPPPPIDPGSPAEKNALEGDGEDDGEEDGVFEEPNASMYGMMERDELAELVARRTGQVPHHKTGKEKLIATLQALDTP